MAEADLRLLLRTVADTRGAEQTSTALRKVSQQSQQTTGTTDQMTASVLKWAGGLAIASTAASVLTGVLASSITTQRENERLVRATAAAYGQQAQEFERFAAALSQTTGFTSQAILEAALSARTLSTNYGLTIQQTQTLIRASADLAKVRGIGVAEAFERVQSAIRGEAEASEYLGLTLNDTFIKNNALNGSVKTTFERMTDAQKAQIRYTELLRQAAAFQGLATSSAGSLDAAFLKAESSANKFQLTLGKAVQPAVLVFLDMYATALKDVEHILWRISTLPELKGGAPAGGGGRGGFTPATAAEVAAQVRGTTTRVNRLAALNENLPPVADAGTAARVALVIKEQAFLDQRDAAIRDLLSAQREELDLKTQLADMEKQHGDMAQRRYQVELAMIAAQQRALPAQQALQDTERAMERARLVLAMRGRSAAERSAARGEIRNLARNVAPGQRLAAFDAETGIIGAQRGATAFDLSARVTQIAIDQAMGRQEGLIAAAAARVDQQNQVLAQIMQAAIEAGFVKRPPQQITIQVLNAEGQVTYEELIEATDQAQMPPVVRVSGVRR